MSASAELLRATVEAGLGPERTQRTAPESSIPSVASPEIISLAHQAFFPRAINARQRILFAGVDEQTNASGVAERVARALAEMNKTVSLVERIDASTSTMKKPSLGVRNVEYWSGFQVAENFWRIPVSTLGGGPSSHSNGNAFGALPFECVVLASSISDAITPLFLELCEGAVLVLTAHKTRKDAALRAKQMLEQCNVKLIGSVLDGRTFPIPESIYRRL